MAQATSAGDVAPPGITRKVLVEGSGPSPLPGWTVAVKYTGYLPSGEVLDSSSSRGDGVQHITLGGRAPLLPGLVQGLQLMRAGETAELTIPPHLAYGDAGMPDADPPIPPSCVIRMHVEMLSCTAPAGSGGSQASQGEAEGKGEGTGASNADADAATPGVVDQRFANGFGMDFVAAAARHKEEGNKLLQSAPASASSSSSSSSSSTSSSGKLAASLAAYEQALACLDQAVAVNAVDAEQRKEEIRSLRVVLHSNSAAVYLRQRQWQLAVAAADAALAIEPSHDKAQYRKAKALQGLGKREEALVLVRALLAVRPTDAACIALLAELDATTAGAAAAAATAGAGAGAGASASASSAGSAAARASSSGTAGGSVAAAAAAGGGKAAALDPLAAAARALAQGKGGLYADKPNYDAPLPDLKPAPGAVGMAVDAASAVVKSVWSLVTAPVGWIAGACCSRRRGGSTNTGVAGHTKEE